MLFADENFFNLFSFPLVRGDQTTALKDISSVVITETVARKFFNSIDVVGKRMIWMQILRQTSWANHH